MIVTENYMIKDKPFVRTYSDKGMMIEREGAQYSEANDPAELGREYTETDIPIEVEEDIPEDIPEDEPVDNIDELKEKAEAYDILMGVDE